MTQNRHARRAAEAIAAKPANRARGEYKLTAGDKVFTLCLSLNAMAEIEDELEIDGLQQLQTALADLSTRKIGVILAALARGGGHEDATADDMRRLNITLQEGIAAISGAFAAAGAFGDAAAQSAQGPAPGN